MSITYSINVGQPTESFRNQDINSSLLYLPDNTQKLISPKDVRDAFLTTWASSAFKQTIGQAGVEYLGIDSGNPSDRDIKQKIFIGKRNYAGNDIMSSSLLGDGSTDIYIYNTKLDAATQSTKIKILAGTDSTLYTHAPFIQSEVINGGTTTTLDFVNPSPYAGPINLYSATGRVAINNIMFPTVAETTASASNGRILKYYGTYPNGVFKWVDPTVSLSVIGASGSTTDIYGSPINVNGYSLEFVDDTLVPETIGGIQMGSSFSANSFNGQNWPLSEVIRKLLYPYVTPSLSIDVSNYALMTTGLTYSGTFDYSVYRYSNIIYEYEITGTTYSGLSYSGTVGTGVTSSFVYPIYSDATGDQYYVLQARDNDVLLTFSHSATASVEFVHPSFYGFDAVGIPIDGTGGSQLGTFMNSSTRVAIKGTQSHSFGLTGSGYIYFAFPYTYPLLQMIKDPNSFIIHDSTSLTHSSFTYSSASTTPSGAVDMPSLIPVYRIYKTTATCSYTGGGNFEFIF